MLCYAMLSHFSRVRLCVTPQTAAHQAPPSLGFSRQEHWNGLPFPSPTVLKFSLLETSSFNSVYCQTSHVSGIMHYLSFCDWFISFAYFIMFSRFIHLAYCEISFFLWLNNIQCSCLENPRDGGAWRAAIYGVAQSRTRLKRLSSSSNMYAIYIHHIPNI